MIEWRWGLAPLTVRDATTNNLADLLDFAQPDLAAPAFAVPAGPFGGALHGRGERSGRRAAATGAARPSMFSGPRR